MQPLGPCPYSHRGTGGQGCLLHATSSNSQLSAFGHWTSLHGSWHWHLGHPASSRAKPCGHSMRHVWAAHGFGSAMKSNTIFISLFHMFINSSFTLFQSPLGTISPPTLMLQISMKSSRVMLVTDLYSWQDLGQQHVSQAPQGPFHPHTSILMWLGHTVLD